jgi:glycosyltransferase involved in cell wall biosynthesis
MDLKDIHICISAYACDPTKGSEPGIGWNIVKEVAQRHRVWAITRRKNEPAISAELQRAPLANLRMIYFDLPRSVLAFKRGQVGIEWYYRLWQVSTRAVVRRLQKEVRLDLTQHVTFGRYWAPTSLAHISAPFIWGPVGGGETTPDAFLEDFDWRGRAYELIRDRARRWSERKRSVRIAAQRSALALAVTSETRDRLLSMGTKRVELFSAMGFDRATYNHLTAMPSADRIPVRFVSIGRLLHWKGFHLGLKGFAAAALPGAEYWIVGDGPQRPQLAALVRALGLEDRVRFWGSLSRAEVLRILADCHVLVHPSLHDSGGWVCLEAMAAGRPVICLDLGGPGEQVTDETGVKIAPHHPKQAVADLARAMTDLGCSADLRARKGEAGRIRVHREYLWEKKGRQLDALYASVLEESRQPTVSGPSLY